MKLNYAIIGTGALGGYYGGKLAQAGQQVHFLFHNDYEYVKKNGLQVDSVKGDFLIKPINAYDSAGEMPLCEVVLVCLKTTNNYLLKEILPPLLREDTVIVLIQNGLGIEHELAGYFPDHTIAGGLAFICSEKKGPGRIAHYDFGNIKIGTYQGGHEEIVEQIFLDLKHAGLHAEKASDLNKARWEKLVWNIPYNGMTVVMDTTTDRLMKQHDSRQLIWELMAEVVEAANQCGAGIDIEFAHKMMYLTDRMTPYAPSMKVDYDAGRPLEIKAIYTNPVMTALEAGYNMRKVAMLEKQLLFLQSKSLYSLTF